MSEIMLPQWPQTISLTPGSARKLALPVVSTGSIHVELEWDGGPIDLKLVAPDGSTVSSLSHQSPPTAILDIDVTPDQIKKGALWTLEILSEGAGFKDCPVKIMMKAPPFRNKDLIIIQKQYTELSKVNEKALNELDVLVKQNPPDPILTSILPGHAYEGETITIKGSCFGLIDGQNEVWFEVDGDMRSNIAVNGVFALNDETLTVIVPHMSFDPHKNIGKVYVRRLYDTKRSDFLEFVFDAKLNPNILSASPAAAKEGASITLQGENFGTDINNLQAFFILPDGTILAAAIQSASNTSMTVTVPDYVLSMPAVGQVVVKRKYVADWVAGNPFSFTFLPTIAGITNYYTWNPNLAEYKNADSHTVSPKGWLCIEGYGFGDAPGKVFFRPKPGENFGDNIIWMGDREMNVRAQDWSDTQILATLPNDEYYPFEGEFYVRTVRPSGQIVDSPVQPIHIRPTYMRKAISFSRGNVDVGQPTAAAGNLTSKDDWGVIRDGISVLHNTDVLSGRSGNDVFFWYNKTVLKNFFVVDHVVVNVVSDRNKTSATIINSYPDSNNPAVQIFWGNAVDIGFFSRDSYPLSYLLYIYLRGPQGYDYQ
jgi:hypothetical protein